MLLLSFRAGLEFSESSVQFLNNMRQKLIIIACLLMAMQQLSLAAPAAPFGTQEATLLRLHDSKATASSSAGPDTAKRRRDSECGRNFLQSSLQLNFTLDLAPLQGPIEAKKPVEVVLRAGA